MKNMKFWRTALVAALVLTVMLSVTGGTIAWFTDTAKSANNKIEAGELDVQLLMNTGEGYVDISDSTTPIFGMTSDKAQNNSADTLWEPGKTQVAYLAIKNDGNLALKYKVGVNVVSETQELSKAMLYAITPDAQYDSVKTWDATNAQKVVTGAQNVSGDVSLAVGATHYFALSIHMDEAAGNEYQGGSVEFDITVYATQATVESDAFGTDYDKNADYVAEAATADDLASAVSAGGNVKMTDNVNLTTAFAVPEDVDAALDLGGKTLANSATGNGIQNSGTLALSNGTVQSVLTYAVNNSGTLTIDDVTTVGGALYNAGTLTVNSGTFSNTVAQKHGVYNSSGASVEINGGTFTTTSTNALIYNASTNVITISGGSFTQGAKSYIIDGGNILITGGSFNGYVNTNGSVDTIRGNNVVIQGGTFNFNPTSWVATGYTVTENTDDGTWTVTTNTTDGE